MRETDRFADAVSLCEPMAGDDGYTIGVDSEEIDERRP